MAWFLPSCGFSSQASDSSVVREGVCDGVTFLAGRPPKGLEGSSEQEKEERLVRGRKLTYKITARPQREEKVLIFSRKTE